MTNFSSINKKSKIVTPENSVIFIPIFIGLLILVSLLSLVFRPLLNKLEIEESQIELLEEKISHIPNYKKLVNDISLYSGRAKKQQLRLLEIISDKNELETILSELNKISLNNNLEIVTILPQPIVSFSKSNIKNNSNKKSAKVRTIGVVENQAPTKLLISELKGVLSNIPRIDVTLDTSQEDKSLLKLSAL